MVPHIITFSHEKTINQQQNSFVCDSTAVDYSNTCSLLLK